MTVYVVTSGEYSDYGINAVFTDRTQANLYTLLHPCSQVEEYEADAIVLNGKERTLRVTYRWWEHCQCHEGKRCSEVIEAYISDKTDKSPSVDDGCFTFYTEMPTQLAEDIKANGKDSPLLKKIAEDAFAQYLFVHNTTAEMLHKKFVYAREKKEEREMAQRWAAALKAQRKREMVLEKAIDNNALQKAFGKSDLTAHFDCPVLTVSGFSQCEISEMLHHVGMDRLSSFMRAIKKYSEDGYKAIKNIIDKYKAKSIKIGDEDVELTFSGEEN